MGQALETMWQDLRYALRILVRNPGFSSVVVLMLTLGIGANTAIFSFVNGVLLRPLPFPEPEELVVIYESNLEKGRPQNTVSPRNLEDWESMSRTIDRFAAWRDWGFTTSTPEGPKGVFGGIATPSLFQVLGINAFVGRTFLPEENQPGRDNVVLLSHSYWQRRFGGDPNIIGQALTLGRGEEKSFTIVGVLHPSIESLDYLGRMEIFAPLSIDEDQYKQRNLRNRRVYGRLKAGVTISEAQVEMSQIAESLAGQYPNENAGWGVSIVSLLEDEVGSVRSALLVFFGAVGLVLLIACANLANLLLARAVTRRKEFAIRAALGARRSQIVRRLLTESLVLALIGGASGLLLARWAVDLFIALGPGRMPRVAQVEIDLTVLTFTFLISVLTGLIFGLFPGIHASRVDLTRELKEGSRGVLSGSGARLRGLFVVSQVALSVVLLVGAGLLSRTFVQLVTLRPGFNPNNLLTISVSPPMAKYRNRDQVAALYQRITDELSAIPGVKSVGVTTAGPQFGGWEPIEFLPEGEPAPASGQYPQTRYHNIGPNYFRTLEVPVLKGREFTVQDNAQAPAVAVINETMARQFWPNGDSIGKRVQLVRHNEALEIIGVVGDIKRFGLGTRVEPEIYWPYMQQPRWFMYFVIRSHSDLGDTVPAVRSRIAEIDKDVLVSNVSTMNQLVARTMRDPRFNLTVLGIFAGLALLLMVVGFYGVISYTVVQRTHEIGIRLALGARPRDVLNLVLKQGLILTLVGLAIGIGAALALTRFLSSMLFNVSATDPLTFAGVAVLLTIVALLASYIPARRASRVDPLISLRHE